MSMYCNRLQPALQNLLQHVQFFHPRSLCTTHISADVFGRRKSLKVTVYLQVQILKTVFGTKLLSGFLRQPWIQGQPWKAFEFQKTENGLELFWKKNGRLWKVWNLSIMKVSTRLGDCVNCCSCCKAGRRTAQTVLLINITHQCFKSVHLFFLSISRAVCYRMINWKKGIELALNYWMKRLWKALNF